MQFLRRNKETSMETRQIRESSWEDIRDITKFYYHSGLWPKVSLVFEDFRLQISEGYKQNWSFPVLFGLGRINGKTTILLVALWNFKLRVLK